MHCRQCGGDNPPVARFCNQCGAALTPAAAAERRQLTVMFCDLVGSTALSERLDPEDLREVLSAYHSAAEAAIAKQDGHIAQYLGDGLLVYFGYPQAHEDDARRSLLAARSILEALKALNESAIHPELSVRIGVHTGPVVIGEVGGGKRREQLALGETPNLAARLQGLAEPGSIVVSGATYRLTASDFAFRPIGSRELKGLAAPVEVWEVTGAAPSRRAARSALVGREREMAVLRGRWTEATHSRGHVAIVKGEPGIGKSRFALGLRDEVRRAGNLALESRCSPYYRDSAFHPIIELIERAARIERDEPDGHKFAKLEGALAPLGGEAVDSVPLISALLSIPLPRGTSAPLLSPQAARERTFEALIATLRAAAARGPALLVVEDLQWADPSTLELLRRVIPRAATQSLLLLLTARPEFRAPWPESDAFSELALEPCSQADARAIVASVAGAGSLTAQAVERIVARTEGNPLFIEVFTRAALDAGATETSATPTTLHGLLMARLDRLGPAKAVLQQAAVIGRTFSFDLLHAVCGLELSEVRVALLRCVEAGLIAAQGVAPEAGYTFGHALLQDAAYQSLLRSARQQCHRRVAGSIEAKTPQTIAVEPELLAYHYTEAAMPAEAIAHWLRAAQQALARSACLEAIAHTERGIALARTQPPGAARTSAELDLELLLGAALIAMRGVSAPEVEQAFARCSALCEALGPTPKLAYALWGLWGYALVRARFAEADELSKSLGVLAQSTAQPGIAMVAAEARGMTLFYMGDLGGARDHFARGLALYRAPEGVARIERGVHRPGIMCFAFDMLACWLAGLPDQALAAGARLHRGSHALTPFDVAFCCCADAVLSQFRREPAAVRRSATRAVEIATEQGFAAWRAMGTVLRGWSMARLGNCDEGIARIRRGYDSWCSTGAHNLRPYFLALLGDASIAAGRHAEALAVLAEAADQISAGGERWWEAEIHRLRGEALLAGDPAGSADAEDCFRSAIAIAQAQGTRAWQLRAATSLARSLGARGQKDEARCVLADLRASFSEGFATPDLEEARILLAGVGE